MKDLLPALQRVLRIQARVPTTLTRARLPAQRLFESAQWTLAQSSALVMSAVGRFKHGAKAVMAALSTVADDLRCPVWYGALTAGDVTVTSQHCANWVARPTPTPEVESRTAPPADSSCTHSPKALLLPTSAPLPQPTTPGPPAVAASTAACSASHDESGAGEPSSVAGSISFAKGWMVRRASPPPASPAASLRFLLPDDAVSSVGDNPFDDLECCEDLSSDVGPSQGGEVSTDLKSCKGGVSGDLAPTARGHASGDLKSCKDTLLPAAAESLGDDDLWSLFSGESDWSPVKPIDPARMVDPFEGQPDLEDLFEESSQTLSSEQDE